jgi:hypothetical protein
MMWLKWVSAILLVLAGVEWFAPGTVSSYTSMSIAAGYTLTQVVGVVAVALGLWEIYEMTMKK